METGRKIEILSVEDNEADRGLLESEFTHCRIAYRLNFAVDGVDAMDYLLRRGKYANSPTPDLVLLDLNLPRKDGREVLHEMKSHLELRSIPVVVLSTSSLPSDVSDAYRGGASGFISKPNDIDEFGNVVRTLEAYWMKLVALPHTRITPNSR